MVRSHHIIASSVQGHQHILKGLPNQDAYRCAETDKLKLAVVADGHGSKTCFRSQWGAEFAVEESRDLLLEVVATQAYEMLHDPQKLFKQLLKRWAVRILKHLKSEPFKLEEVESLSALQRKTVGRNALIAYGTTLSMVLFFKNHLYIWKVGDGSIIIREGEGEPVKELLDRKWFGVETHSLSTCNPAKDLEFMILTPPPKDLLMCSDGYKNSFRSDSDYYKALADFSTMYKNQEGNYIEDHVEEWLTETSRLGSGDDITLVLFLSEDKVS